ncbi:cysteine-rich and transmembrane domain-containing protein 1 isoform X1 [Willisornis vidua]|uniref:Cysteine-rich and transmembrane domain-containing protein 1 n=1 Tax=Willisornis vidua TaxID=1566151 RepID=A0ABQ9DGN1_9PASS|nr:cysteine-rich and transmembrane domain-containing protein 1 isoform X1 [Willisornis vidua]
MGRMERMKRTQRKGRGEGQGPPQPLRTRDLIKSPFLKRKSPGNVHIHHGSAKKAGQMMGLVRTDSASHMNYDNPPPYPGPGPTAPYPPYAQQPGGPPGPYPGYPPGPYQPGQPGYQGYPQYGWQNAPPPPGPVYADGPKNTVLWLLQDTAEHP